MYTWTKDEAAQDFINLAIHQRAAAESLQQVILQFPASGLQAEAARDLLVDAMANEDTARRFLVMDVGEASIMCQRQPPAVAPDQIERVRQGLEPLLP